MCKNKITVRKITTLECRKNTLIPYKAKMRIVGYHCKRWSRQNTAMECRVITQMPCKENRLSTKCYASQINV